jgi:hypothetical protein
VAIQTKADNKPILATFDGSDFKEETIKEKKEETS